MLLASFFIDEGAEVIYSTSSRKEVVSQDSGPRAPALNHYAALSSWLCAGTPAALKNSPAYCGGGVGGEVGVAKGPLGLCGWALPGCCWRRSKRSAFAQWAWSKG